MTSRGDFSFETPDAIIARLSANHPPGFDLTLDRIRDLLHRLGDPHLDIAPPIHVAGTNGKGSTVAFLRAILEASGRRVHTHTSPHLVRFNERFRLATGPGTSAYVGDDALSQALLRVERVNAGEPTTVFELLTAAAFLLFASHPADVTLLEVGLGGRLDATNVIEKPLVSVITSIGLDHQKYLGETLEKIAGEKAGIIKRDTPVVAAPQDSERIYDVFDYCAARMGTRVARGGQDWTVWSERGRLIYQDEESLLDLPLPRLPGPHQITNAGTAIAALKATGLPLYVSDFEKGVANVHWPGRLQQLNGGALAEYVVPGSEIWLDGGHNPAAGKAVSEAMADLEERVERPLFLITGMLHTKDPVGFFRAFESLARHVFTVPLSSTENDIHPDDLADAASEAGLSAEPCDSVMDALEFLASGWQYERPPRILIGGSLYLVGEVLAMHGKELT